jgi:hypothetical protein
MPGHTVYGDFVDGGVSLFNNPRCRRSAATMCGYRINWPMGENNIPVVSVGTGSADVEIAEPKSRRARLARSLS